MNTLGSIGTTGLLASINKSESTLLSNLQKLASGKAINSAADNPVAVSQSASYNVQLSSLAQTISGMQDSGNLLEVAGSAIGQVSESLQQLNELVIQAGNGTLSSSDRQIVQTQANQILQGLDQISSGTSFNGRNLLDGSFSQAIQNGPNGETQTVVIGSTSSTSLGVSGLDLTTDSGRSTALSSIANALQSVDNQQAQLGAIQAGLQAGVSNASATYGNIAAANSQISDTDYAQATSDAARNEIQQQASTKALALYNAMQKNVLGILP